MTWRNVSLLLLTGLSLTSSGCLFLAAGAAGAGAATYFYVRGKLCQEYYASFPDSWQAVLKTLQEQGLTVTHQENNGVEGTITSKTTDGSTITFSLSTQTGGTAAEKSVTRVCVRVGTWGNDPLQEKLLAQIATHLVPTGLQPRIAPTASGTPATGGVRSAGWNEPQETAPPPEASDATAPRR